MPQLTCPHARNVATDTAMASLRSVGSGVGDARREPKTGEGFGGRFATGASLPPNARPKGTSHEKDTRKSSLSSPRDTGHVELVLRNLEWFGGAAPAYCRVVARWWGDDFVSGDTARPWVGLGATADADATFIFPVVVKPTGFAKYVKDCAHLILDFSDGRTGQVIAHVSIDVSRLSVGHPVSGGKPVRTPGGATRGAVHVSLSVDFHPKAMSSFERNEARCAETGGGGGQVGGDEDEVSGKANDTTLPHAGGSSSDGSEGCEKSNWSGDGGDGVARSSPLERARLARRLTGLTGNAKAPPVGNAGTARRLKRGSESKAVGASAKSSPSLPPDKHMTPLEAAEALRDEMDSALKFDGVSACSMIDAEMEVARRTRRATSGHAESAFSKRKDTDTKKKTSTTGTTSSTTVSETRQAPRSPLSAQYCVWVKSAACIDSDDFGKVSSDADLKTSQNRNRWSLDTSASERAAAIGWLGGNTYGPDGSFPDAGDAALCAEEALVSALARFEGDEGNSWEGTNDEDRDDDENKNEAETESTTTTPENGRHPVITRNRETVSFHDPVTEHALAAASATEFTDAQLGAPSHGHPTDGPGLEIRLTLHDGSVRALDGGASCSFDASNAESSQSLVVLVKGGHPFRAGELARVVLDGVGSRGSGCAVIAVPAAVVDAIVDATKKTPALALEVWDPKDLVGSHKKASKDCDVDDPDADSVAFASLFGDFAAAGANAMVGVVPVSLDVLRPACLISRARHSENRRWGLTVDDDATDEGDASSSSFQFKHPPLNRVFEIRNVWSGDVCGFLGVEAAMAAPKTTKAARI